MNQNDIWHEFILPHLERKFPDSLIGRIKERFPDEGIVAGAFCYLQSEDEVRQFFSEYTYFCRLCEPDNPNDEETIAILAIVGYFIVIKDNKIPALWIKALKNEITIVESAALLWG